MEINEEIDEEIQSLKMIYGEENVTVKSSKKGFSLFLLNIRISQGFWLLLVFHMPLTSIRTTRTHISLSLKVMLSGLLSQKNIHRNGANLKYRKLQFFFYFCLLLYLACVYTFAYFSK